MKRLLAAVGLALLLHGVVFLADFDWLMDRTVQPRISQFVTVTMSYRQTDVKEAASEKKEEVTPQEIPKPEKIEAPKSRQKTKEKPLETRAAKSEEKEVVSAVQQEEFQDEGDEKTPDATLQKEASTRDSGGATGRVREAVPRYKINPPPRYPRAARRRGIQGTVVLSVYVDAQGRVANLWLLESSGYRVLDNSALEAVKKWSFEPGRKGDTKVAMWVNVPVRFELQ
jgi:protein TonB